MHGPLLPYCSSNLVDSSPMFFTPILGLLSKETHVWLERPMIQQHHQVTPTISFSRVVNERYWCNSEILEKPTRSKLTVEDVHFYKYVTIFDMHTCSSPLKTSYNQQFLKKFAWYFIRNMYIRIKNSLHNFTIKLWKPRSKGQLTITKLYKRRSIVLPCLQLKFVNRQSIMYFIGFILSAVSSPVKRGGF